METNGPNFAKTKSQEEIPETVPSPSAAGEEEEKKKRAAAENETGHDEGKRQEKLSFRIELSSGGVMVSVNARPLARVPSRALCLSLRLLLPICAFAFGLAATVLLVYLCCAGVAFGGGTLPACSLSACLEDGAALFRHIVSYTLRIAFLVFIPVVMVCGCVVSGAVAMSIRE